VKRLPAEASAQAGISSCYHVERKVRGRRGLLINMFVFCSVLTLVLKEIIWGKWKKVGKSGENNNKMFIGQYEHSVDEKGRLAIPAKFRRSLTSGAVITKGLDGCLFVFPKERWQKMAESIGELPYTKSSARAYARLILASAVDVEFDKQGRVVVPNYLRKYASLKTQAIVAGLYDRVEIWSRENWTKEMSKIDKEAGKVVEELSELGV